MWRCIGSRRDRGNAMALIEVVNLGQEYTGQYVLKNINLKIDRGEVFALIGPTGAGKTTLLRLLNLLESPASGTLHFPDMVYPS